MPADDSGKGRELESPPSPPAGPPAGWWLRPPEALILVLFFCLCAWRYWCGQLPCESALAGVMAYGLLDGDFPFFFYGQNWMGGYEALVLAPLYKLFGPTVWILNLVSPVLSFCTFVVLFRLALLFLPRRGALSAMLFLAVPPATAAIWVGFPNIHYPLGIFLSSLLLAQTVKLWRAQAWRFRPVFFWGILAGAAFYTNFQTVVVIGPAGLFLLFTRGKRFLSPALLWMALGSALGGAPLLYYNFTHHWPHLSQAGTVNPGSAGRYLADLFTNALPMSLGFNTPVSGGATAPGHPMFYLYLAVAALMLLGAVAALSRAIAKGQTPLLIFLGIGLLNIGLLVFSDYGRRLSSATLSYVLPLIWFCLPVCLGAAAARVAKYFHFLWLLLPLALVANNFAAYPYNQRGDTGRFWCTRGGAHLDEPEKKGLMKLFRQAGVNHIYRVSNCQLAFYGARGPIISHAWDERRVKTGCLVDAADNPAWLPPLAPSLRFLGLPFLEHKLGGVTYLRDVAQPENDDRLLPRQGWRAHSNRGRDLGAALNDGDFTTRYDSGGLAKPGQGFVLDLGREQTVSGLAIIPGNYFEVPCGLKLEAAGAAGPFAPLREGPNYWGPLYFSGPHPFLKLRFPRVEAYFSPRPMRYLRVSHLGRCGRPISAREVLLFGPGGGDESAKPGWQESGRRMLAIIRESGVKLAVADAWPAALIRLAFGGRVACVVAGDNQDDFGDKRPSARHPLGLFLSRPGALVVTARDRAQVEHFLVERGVAFAARPAGRLAVLLLAPRKLGPRLPITKVFSQSNPGQAAALAGGRLLAKRWSSGKPQTAGDGLVVDLGSPQKVAWLKLENPDHPRDFPRSLAVFYSGDGKAWRPAGAILAGPLVFSGQLVLANPGGQSLYRLSLPEKARYLKIALTQSHPVWWWSLQRIGLY